MRKHALLRYSRDDGADVDGQPISNKSCQTDILGLDKYLQRFPATGANSAGRSAATLRASSYKRPSKKPKVRSVAVHCERRRMTFAAFKGGQKFKHVYKRKISLPQPSTTNSPPTTPSTTTATATPTDDCRRDSGMLPKLRPDRTGTADRPSAACGNKANTGPVVKLPRIPTRDQKLEPDRLTVDGGGTRRLARLTRPLSTGSGSGSGSGGNKLAYFRARSAPKIDSRYRGLITTERSPPAENELSSSSSDTVNTALDVSFVRKRPDDSMTEAGDASNSRIGDGGTRTVSTSTTFAEPVFPIVFSCESVLRHPLDGGYVSHTESHRFSVHYVPIAEAANMDEGSTSSLVFTSAGACQKERCLTGETMSVTLSGGKPVTVAVGDNSTTAAAAADEKFETRPSSVVGSHSLHPVGDVKMADPNGYTVTTTMKPPENDDPPQDQVVRTDGFYVLGKGDPRHVNVNAFGTGTVEVPSMSTDKTIDTFVGEDGHENVEKGQEDKTVTGVEEKKEEKDTVPAAALGSHAHAGDTLLLQTDDDQNYERLAQNLQQTHANRTVSDQSPKPDGTAPLSPDLTHRHNEPKPVEGGTHASGLHNEPTERTANVELTNATADLRDDDLTRIRIGNDNHCLTVPLEPQSYENTDMASHRHRKHRCESTTKHEAERLPPNPTGRTQFCKQTDHQSMQRDGPRYCEPATDVRRSEYIGNCKHHVPPGRLCDNVNRTRDGGLESNRDPYHVHASYSGTTTHPNKFDRYREKTDGRSEHTDGRRVSVRDSDPARANVMTNGTTHRKHFEGNHNYHGRFAIGPDEKDSKRVMGFHTADYDSIHGREDPGSRMNGSHVREDGHVTNTCRRCTGSLLHATNGMKNGTESRYDAKAVDNLGYRGHTNNNGKNPHNPMSKSRLESVDETAESKESNYIGGFLFGDAYYKKRPQKYEADNERDGRAKYDDEYYDDSKMPENFPSKPNYHYGYYGEYVPKTSHSARDEDCTVFADANRNPSENRGKTGGVPHDQRYSTVTEAPAHMSYYSQLNKSTAAVQAYGDENKNNSDSDDSLTDSLEDGSKYDGAAVSYFLALDGNQKSAVTFTLKMPNTLESRLNRRQSRLKKHLHVSTTVRKTPVRVRTRHKGCQTLWTEEKGVQVQRGSTATAARKAAMVDDRKVLETLLAGLERNRVSENQIRVVGGQKMVSEGNQTEQPPPLPSDRHIQTQTRTTMLREAAVGPGTPENNAAATSGEQNCGKGTPLPSHMVKKFSSDNALMVGVLRQNKYKGKEPLPDGAKNDQHFTLSKGWINFYTLRAESADTDAQGNHDTVNKYLCIYLFILYLFILSDGITML